MPELDVVRGLAISLVLFSHFLAWSYPEATTHATAGSIGKWASRLLTISLRPGWIGVHLFFVLSGFLITGIIIDARGQRDFMPRFYARRVARIQPALLLTVAVICLLRVAGLPSEHLSDVTATGVVVALLFAANLAPLFGIPNPFGPLWSLAIEEQFYLGWPSIVRRLSLVRLRSLCIAGMLLCPLVRVVGFRLGCQQQLSSITWYCLDGLFAGGMLACQLRIRRDDRSSARRLAWLLATIAVITIGAQFLTKSLSRQTLFGAAVGPSPWVLLSGTLILATLCVGSNPRLKRLGEIGVLQDLGFVSYGLYLYHPVVMALGDHFLGGIAYPAPNAEPRIQDMLWRLLILTVASYHLARWSRITFEEWFLARKQGIESFALRLARFPEHRSAV